MNSISSTPMATTQATDATTQGQSTQTASAQSSSQVPTAQQLEYFQALVAAGNAQGSSTSAQSGQSSASVAEQLQALLAALNLTPEQLAVLASLQTATTQNAQTATGLGAASNGFTSLNQVPPSLSTTTGVSQNSSASSANSNPIVPSDAAIAAMLYIQIQQVGQGTSGAGTATTQNVSTADAIAQINSIAALMANQILVTPAAQTQAPQTVIISLQDSVLPATQIQVQRTNLGVLDVQFITQNPNSALVLNAIQSSVQSSLSNTLGGSVNVGVSSDTAQSAAFQQDAGSGSSRGQYLSQDDTN